MTVESDVVSGGASIEVVDLAVAGPAAPPRLNGELVFDEPWQPRAFGVAAVLAESGRIHWSDFQAALILAVGESDARGADTGQPDVYWTCWLEALGHIVDGLGLFERGVWSARCDELAARTPGHDH
jgi:nitrile hydratase accessory protein